MVCQGVATGLARVERSPDDVAVHFQQTNRLTQTALPTAKKALRHPRIDDLGAHVTIDTSGPAARFLAPLRAVPTHIGSNDLVFKNLVQLPKGGAVRVTSLPPPKARGGPDLLAPLSTEHSRRIKEKS